MKKIFALLVVCVFSASFAVAQVNNNHRTAARHYFERLDSDSRSKLLKSHKVFWQQQKKENDKKWKKHVAMVRQRIASHPQEQMPIFIGGKEALTSWIEQNVTYPVSADLTGIEGKVLVAFDVNADGTIGNVRVEQSANSLLESELVSKIQEMPRWIPAFQNGRPVKVKYTLPINFTLQS